MRKVLLTFGSILSIALSVGVSVSCGTRTSTPTREVNPSIDDLVNKAGDIKTPSPIEEKDNKDKPDKPVPQVQLINPEKTKEELKDQDIEQAKAEALAAMAGWLNQGAEIKDYKSKITLAKTKDEITNLMSEAWKKEENRNS